MSSTLTVSGTQTIYPVPGGPSVSPVFGSPSITPSTTGGFTLDYDECSIQTMYVTQLMGVTSVPFGTVTTASYLYIGSDQEIKVILNGGTDEITIAADGWIALADANITSATVEATLTSAEISVVLAGDKR